MDLSSFSAQLPRGDFWVFGYGSLMWSPDFSHAERRPAFLRGYHRSLCILSHRYRGTPDQPGLVMGLCRGGSCWGVAFRVAERQAMAALAALWEREMSGRVYHPRLVPVVIARARRVRALAFVADTAHTNFTRSLSVADTARMIAEGRGQRGHNIEYLEQTLAHMDELGVRDRRLHQVMGMVRALRDSTPRR